MKTGKQISVAWYAVIDFVTASLAWACFFFIRKWVLKETITDQGEIIVNNKFWLGIIFIPLGWLALYTLVGSYRKLYKIKAVRIHYHIHVQSYRNNRPILSFLT